MALTGTLSWQPIAIQTSQLDLVTATGTTPTGAAGTAFGPLVVTDGTGANQATNYVSDIRTLAAGASETIDFNGGLVDSFGVHSPHFPGGKGTPNQRHGSSDCGVGGCPNHEPVFQRWFHSRRATWRLYLLGRANGGGHAVVAGAEDQLTFTNGSGINPATYDIIAIGS